MQTENSIIADLKNTYRNGGMTIKLIFINVLVFIFIGIIEVLSKIIGGGFEIKLLSIIHSTFSMQTSFKEFIIKPWGLFTNFFAHYKFFHLLMNMLVLYGAGRIFEQFFSANRLLYTYILGGIFGALLELTIHSILPGFSGIPVVGASGAVIAIVVAISFYQPRLTVSVFGLFNMRLIFLALILILSNLYNAGMGTEDGTAYFAHLGGALLGYISVQNPFSTTNIINRGIRAGNWIVSLFKPKTKNGNFRYSKSKASEANRFKTDAEYNMEAKQRQEKIDVILDKISKSGYESLTKGEKEFLFKQSNQK